MNLAILDEQNFIWDIDGLKVSGLVSDRVLKRKLTQINSLYLQELAETLRLRTSVKNPADGKKYYSVLNPMVNGLEYSGRWRGGLVETFQDTRETGKIVQTLNYGWATTLIDSEARLVGGDNIPLQPERIIQRQYVSLDFTELGTMIEGIESTKYVTNPVIEGKTYDGPLATDLKWRILSSKPSRADDGSGIITQTLAKNLVMTLDALPTPILLTDDKVLLSPFLHDTTSVKNAYIWEYRWIDPDYAQALRDTISLTAGVMDAKIVKAEDGSCNIQVLTQTNTWKGNLSQVWERQNQFHGFAAERILDTFSHIASASLSGFRTTLQTATSGYKVSSLTETADAEGGFYSLRQEQEKLFSGAPSAVNGTRMEDEILQIMTAGVMRTTMWLGVADADLDAALTTLSTAPEGYSVLRVGHNYRGIGSADIIRVMVTKGDETAEQLRIDFPTFEGERRTYYYFGLDKTTASAKYVTCQTTADTGFKVDNVNIIEWRTALAVVQQISKIMVTPVEEEDPVEELGHDVSKEFEWWGNGEVITKKWLAIQDAELDAYLTTLATAPEGYSVVSIGHNYNGTGSADIVRVVVKQNTTGFESSIEFPTFEGERKTNIYLGLNYTDAETKYTTCQTPPAGYKVDSVTKQQGLRSTITVIQQLSKVQGGSTSAVHGQDYTRTFGLVTMATTTYLKVPYAKIGAVKTAILAISGIFVLNIIDNDNGQGAADITYTWRTSEATPRKIGDITISKPTQFSGQTNDRIWIDVNLTSQTALADAVALALAGTAPYTLAADEQVLGASGQDAGDKTGNITQRIFKKPDAYTYADYTEQQSINPHGLKEAVMALSVREYPEVAYADLGTIFALLQTFLGTPPKGQIRVSFDRNRGTFGMVGIKEGTPDWDNTTPTYVQTGIRNVGAWAESNEKEATGVPVADAAAIVAAATADADYALDAVVMQERGNGEAVVSKRQSKKDGVLWTTRIEPTITIGATGEILQRGRTITRWDNVPAADFAGLWAGAALTTNVDATHLLVYRQDTRLANGFHNVESAVAYFDATGKANNYFGWLGTETWVEYDHQYWRQEWRCIQLTTSEYRGTSFSAAENNYRGNEAGSGGTGDKDSVLPEVIGYNAGSAVYRSIRVNRAYGSWVTGAAPTQTSAHSGHGNPAFTA